MTQEIKIFNTMSGKKEKFETLEAGKAGIYVCGVTPYNDPHIGNARPFVVWDTIRRFLEKAGYAVRYIQNFTDVDDKIIRAANEADVTWKEISDKYIAAYFIAMDALNIRRADVYPRVSDHIADIIEMIAGLVEKGYAYPLEGDVYYRVEKFAEYGKLSGRKLSDMMAGARVEIDDRKENPMDFALWKGAKPGEPAWESPWGKGRPGWHIECSVMSLKYLGESFDVHGGGSDLIFPHHENEIAQSRAYLGDKGNFARYWVHNGFITINQEKMSKSLNNFFTVADILKEYPGEVVRFFILGTHYRSPLDFSDTHLKEAQAGLARLAKAKENADALAAKFTAEKGNTEIDDIAVEKLWQAAEKAKENFLLAMADDFNTALAISYIFELAKEINIYYQKVINGHAAIGINIEKKFAKAKGAFDEMLFIIGILEQKSEAATAREDEAQEIEALIAERLAARKAKDWKKADAIRDGLRARGIIIEDTASGTNWKRA